MTIGHWRDIAIILLAIESIILALIPGVLFFVLWKVTRKGIKWLSDIGFPKAKHYSRLTSETTQIYSQKINRPVVMLESNKTMLAQVFRSIVKTPKQRKIRRQ